MQKPPDSPQRNAKRRGDGFKLWPQANNEAQKQEKPVRFESLRGRFNPRLVGFGIVGFPLADSKWLEDRGPRLHAQEGSCDEDPEEQK